MSDTDLQRRLADLAALATVDEDEGWEGIQCRIAEPNPPIRRTPPRWLMMAAAAAAVVVLGAMVLIRKSNDGGVRTVDDDATSTTVEESPSPTTTTTGSSTTVTSTTTNPTGPGSPTAEGPEGQAGAGSPGTVPSPAPSAPATTTVNAPAPPPTVPGGDRVWISYTASGYTLQGTFRDAGSGRFQMDIWRAGQGQVAQLLLFNRPGQNCLAGGDATDLAFPEGGADIYAWGLVRSDAARVRVVTTDAQSTTATIGSDAYPGVRVWIARIPNDQIDRLEALDSGGNILHDAPWGANLDAYPDSC